MTLHPHLQSLTLALLHFLWQGALLGLLAALAFRLAAGRSPQARYVLGLGFMALALLSPLLTWAWLDRGPGSSALCDPTFLPGGVALRPSGVLPSATALGRALAPALPWVLGAWALGATLLALRLAGGWWWLQRLKARMAPVGAEWEIRIRALARRMGLSRSFCMGLSRDITSPLVIGWIRPVLLIPASLLTGMDGAALEALLAHEVAHLRRHDVLFNWLQCAVEVLLFYHPAVWWISKRTRFERECCCDDAAVADCGDPLRYAESLDRLDDLQSLHLIPAQAAHGANLMHRITRLLTSPARPARLPLVLPLALVAAGAFALSARGAQAQPVPVATTAQATPAPKAKATRPQSEGKSAAAPEAKPAPTPRPEERPESVRERTVSFTLFFLKSSGPKLELSVNRATRAEVEAALQRIESLIKPGEERDMNNGPVRGEWHLKPYRGSEDDLLSFKVQQVTPAEARRLF